MSVLLLQEAQQAGTPAAASSVAIEEAAAAEDGAQGQQPGEPSGDDSPSQVTSVLHDGLPHSVSSPALAPSIMGDIVRIMGVYVALAAVPA